MKQIKINVAENVAQKIQIAADKLGLSFNEYVKKVMGEHAVKLPSPQRKDQNAG